MPSSHSQFMGYFLLVAWTLFAPQKSPEAVPFARSRIIVVAPVTPHLITWAAATPGCRV